MLIPTDRRAAGAPPTLPQDGLAVEADASLFRRTPTARQRIDTPRGTAVVRPVTPLDASGIDTFIQRLSSAARFRRFHSGVDRLSARQLAAIVDVDHIHRETLIAVAGYQVVGVVQFVELPSDPTAVDIAVVVADEWQGLGLGRRLLTAISDAAQGTGHGSAVVLVQGDNAAILHLLRTSGRPLHSQIQGASVDVVVQL